MRSRYLAIARTYCRPMFLFWLAFFAYSLIFIRTSVKLDAELRELSADGLPRGLWLVNAMALAWLGVIMSAHLKEMLGSPNSRVTPDLLVPHFTVAGVIALFAIGIPSALAFAFGLGDAHLTVLTFSLVAFSLGAFLAHWSPNIALVVAPLALLLFFDRNPPWSSPVTETWFAIVVWFGALLAIAFRFRRFNEEMVEYRKRLQMSFPPSDRRFGSSDVGASGWDWLSFVPIRRDFRGLGRSGGLANESLVQRAWHWHAAWRTLWSALGSGIFMGCLLAAMALIKGFSIPELLGSPNIPYLAVFPALRLLGRQQNRPYLADEFLRPESRKEHVRAVGLTLASMVLVCWLLMLTTAFAMLLLMAKTVLSMPDLLQSIGFSICCLSLAFGIAVWPYRTSAVFFVYSALAGVMGSFWLTPLRFNEISGLEFGLVSTGLLVIGVFVTRQSYLRWLTHDLDVSAPVSSAGASWIAKLPRDRRVESQIHELVVVAAIEDRIRKS